MRQLGTALRLEVRLQWRYRFLHAGVFSGVVWLALLLPIPYDLRTIAEPYVILGDLSIVGFFFIAGTVFFGKGDRTLHALVATPLRFREYLASKLVTLILLSAALAVFVATVTHGIGYNMAFLLLGAVLGTLLLLLVGFVSSLPFTSISDWFLPAQGPLAAFLVPPILHFSGLWETPWFYLVPTQGPLLFLGAAFGQQALAGWQIAYGVSYPLVFASGMYVLARRMFDKHVVAKVGGA